MWTRINSAITALLLLAGNPHAAELRERVVDRRASSVVSHSKDRIGYAPERDEYRNGGHEACLFFYGPGLGDWLVKQVQSSLARLEDQLP